MACFNPLWINTALKLKLCFSCWNWGFNPLWINTALKQKYQGQIRGFVSIPYGLTLLSNGIVSYLYLRLFQSPMD